MNGVRQKETAEDILAPKNEGDRRLLNTKELAAFLRCLTRHIARLRKMGLPTITLGRLVRFSMNEVIEWSLFRYRALNLGWLDAKHVKAAKEILRREQQVVG